MSICIQDLSYIHSNRDSLFSELNLTVNPGEKIALIGNNGSGKTTLMRILAGELSPTSGMVSHTGHLFYVPQHFGQYDNRTVAQALQIDGQLNALHSILDGDASIENFTILKDDWGLEERALAVLAAWGLDGISLNLELKALSGGEKTRIFLAGLEIHQPTILLLDEPTNHLDAIGRKRLYQFIQHTHATVLIISHDRFLLNQLSGIYELSTIGLTYYGGNYDFYKEQKRTHLHALQQQLEEKQKTWRQARKKAREIAERKAKQNVRGEKNNNKKGIPRIVLNQIKDHAEKSTSKLSNTHAEKSKKLQQEMQQIKNRLPTTDKLRTNFQVSDLHIGKLLVTVEQLNFQYPETSSLLWKTPLNFQLQSGDRIYINGNNGSGKTTLLKLIEGKLIPTSGTLKRADFSFIYLDQEYSLIKNKYTILEQADRFNHRRLPEHELKTILHRYLFPSTTWNKPCNQLSGGEKMRLSFCCLMITNQTPDLFILDEPTNNLDIESIEIITDTLKGYSGSLLVVSHDPIFLNEIACKKEIILE